MSISACLITKNEAKWLASCLEHLASIVSEFIIIDTGSTDETLDIARERGARVSSIPWENDFAKARNAGLEKATQRWILIIDPDERVADRDLEGLRTLTEAKDVAAYSFTTRNYSTNLVASGFQPCQGEYPEMEKPYPGYFPSKKVRLFQNIPSIRFQGSVHELVEPSIKGKIVESNIPFHHYGSTEEISLERNKREFYQQQGTKKLREEPGNWKAHFEMGVEWLGVKEYTKALEALSEANRLFPDQALILSNLGYALMEAGHHDEAERVLKDCIVVDAKNHDAWLNLGVNEMRRKNWEKALRIFDNLIKQHPQSFLAFRNAGNCFARLQKFKQAVACFQKALEILPSFVEAQIDLGIVYMAGGNPEAAKKLLTDALQKQPNSLRARAVLDEIEGQS